MDKETFEALKIIMGTTAKTENRFVQEAWQQVSGWMLQVEKEIDDATTLGTDDPRRELKVVR